MWKLLAEILTSKKAIATIAGVLLVATNKIGLNLPEEAVTQIVAAIAAYVVSQGLADFSKSCRDIMSPVSWKSLMFGSSIPMSCWRRCISARLCG